MEQWTLGAWLAQLVNALGIRLELRIARVLGSNPVRDDIMREVCTGAQWFT